jgi:SEC-C motif-containing protein
MADAKAGIMHLRNSSIEQEPCPSTKTMTATTSTPCPCGSGQPHARCCAPYIRGAAVPPSAEALMRSRYSAYVLEDEAYLLATWHPQTRPASLDLMREPRPRWLGLTVKAREDIDGDHARVEFLARYKIGGRAFRLHETSRFERIGDHWFYLDGDVAGQLPAVPSAG